MFLHGCRGQQDRLFCLFELNKPPWPYEQSNQTRSTSYSLSICNCCLENGKKLGRGWGISNFGRYVGVFCFYTKRTLTQGLTLCTHCGHRFCSWPLSPSLWESIRQTVDVADYGMFKRLYTFKVFQSFWLHCSSFLSSSFSDIHWIHRTSENQRTSNISLSFLAPDQK